MRQPDAGFGGGSKNARRHFGGVGIGRATRRVVQILKLAHRREARLLHLHEAQRGDGLHLLRG